MVNPDKQTLRKAAGNKHVEVKLETGVKYEFEIDSVEDVLYLKDPNNGEPYMVMNGRLFERIEPPEVVNGIVRETNGEGKEIEHVKIIDRIGD